MNKEFLLKNKNTLIVMGAIVILVVVGITFTQIKKSAVKKNVENEDVLPNVEVLPTVDSSVIVDIKADAKKQNAKLTIKGVPTETTTIEYELSYDADVDGERVPKGAIGTIEFDGKEPVVRDVTLGTCSSGACKYDKGITSIKATVKFTGAYGSQLFEKEYTL